jgi:large subunit ribosomal protein L9
MKVILTANVKGTGYAGDVVNVSDGYARNFLFPKGLAKQASEHNLNIAKQQQQANEKRHMMERLSAEEAAKSLSGLRVVIKAKCGEGKRLFGSVTAKEIAEAIESQHGIEIDKKKIFIEDHIKELGETKAQVKVYAGITSEITVSIEKLEG